MANFVYKKAKQALLNGDIDVSSNQLKVLLLKNNYIPNQNTDQYVSDIPVNAIQLRSQAISSIVNTNGVLDAEDLTITEYDGSPFHALALYQYSPSDTNARLIFYIDTSDGLPFSGLNTANSITIFWSNESNKILSL